MLDSKDIEILLVLQKNPLATLSQIAQEINLSISNTSVRVKKLEEDNMIIQGVYADLNLKALNLEIFDFFIEINSKKSLSIIEDKFSYYHPYLLYRGRCNGKLNGLYTQFRLPKEGLNYLEELLSILKTKDIITNFELVKRNPNQKSLSVKSSFESWNSKKQSWDFDWNNWKKNFSDISDKQINDNNNTESIIGDITELDIKLLAELTMDSRRKNIDIMKNIGMANETGNAQKVSRSLKFLKEKAISDYRVFLHWSQFDLYQSICVKGQCNDGMAYKIKNYLSKGIEAWKSNSNEVINFPFQSLYFITDHGFLWYVRAPPSHLSHFIDFIWDVSPKHDLYFLDYQYSQIYGLWDQTFDTEHKKWKISYEFMIDNVLNKMFK